MTHRPVVDWIEKWGERVATIVLPAILGFFGMVAGLWTTNQEQNGQLEMARKDNARIEQALEKLDDKVDGVRNEVVKLRDDTRDDIRDLRAEIKAHP